MRKKVILVALLQLLFTDINVYAESYDMKLKTNNYEVEKSKNVDIFVEINNLVGIEDGLNVCEFVLDYDHDKLIINSITGEDDWVVTQGEKIVVDNANSIKNQTNIAKINVQVLEDGVLTLSEVNCTDGTNEYSANASSLNLKVKTVSEQSQSQIESSSNSTIDNPKTGIKEISLMFILILFSALIIRKMIISKDLLKNI